MLHVREIAPTFEYVHKALDRIPNTFSQNKDVLAPLLYVMVDDVFVPYPFCIPFFADEARDIRFAFKDFKYDDVFYRISSTEAYINIDAFAARDDECPIAPFCDLTSISGPIVLVGNKYTTGSDYRAGLDYVGINNILIADDGGMDENEIKHILKYTAGAIVQYSEVSDNLQSIIDGIVPNRPIPSLSFIVRRLPETMV